MYGGVVNDATHSLVFLQDPDLWLISLDDGSVKQVLLVSLSSPSPFFLSFLSLLSSSPFFLSFLRSLGFLSSFNPKACVVMLEKEHITQGQKRKEEIASLHPLMFFLSFFFSHPSCSLPLAT